MHLPFFGTVRLSIVPTYSMYNEKLISIIWLRSKYHSFVPAPLTSLFIYPYYFFVQKYDFFLQMTTFVIWRKTKTCLRFHTTFFSKISVSGFPVRLSRRPSRNIQLFSPKCDYFLQNAIVSPKLHRRGKRTCNISAVADA